MDEGPNNMYNWMVYFVYHHESSPEEFIYRVKWIDNTNIQQDIDRDSFDRGRNAYFVWKGEQEKDLNQERSPRSRARVQIRTKGDAFFRALLVVIT